MDIQRSDQQRGGALYRNHWRERLCNHMVLVQTGLRHPGPAATAGARRGGLTEAARITVWDRNAPEPPRTGGAPQRVDWNECGDPRQFAPRIPRLDKRGA